MMDTQDQQPLRNYGIRAESIVKRFAMDAVSAVTAAVMVAPMVTIIDTAVTQVAFQQTTLWTSLGTSCRDLILRPHRMFSSRPFGAMFLLYAGTYMTANAVDTIQSSTHSRTDDATSILTKFTLIAAVNMTLSINKDAVFSRTFARSSLRPLSMATYGPFILRDSITLFASFNLPPVIAASLPNALETGIVSKLAIAQLAAPALSQIFSTPLHLWGLDFYNRPEKLPLRERVKAVRRAMPSATAARICRVLPGLGVGNVVNTEARRWLQG